MNIKQETLTQTDSLYSFTYGNKPKKVITKMTFNKTAFEKFNELILSDKKMLEIFQVV